jgi:putative aldouronate transport system permease protein
VIAGTSISLTIVLGAGFGFSRKMPGHKWLFLVFLFTMFFSGGMIPTYLVVRQLKMLNTIFAMILPGAISVYNMIIMRTFFHNLPEELIDCSELDGCKPIRTLVSIVLPLSLPVISVMILFYAVGHWNSYFDGLIYLSSSRKYPLQLVLRNILLRNTISEYMTIGDDSVVQQLMLAESIKYALILITSIPVLILYPFLQKYFVKGVMLGALKG